MEITRKLVSMNTENSLMPEDTVRKYIETILAPYGFQFFHQQVQAGRTNLLALLEPNSQASLLLFSGHMDTVIGYAACKSSEPALKDGKIFGRGSCDMKGGIAAFLVATINWVNQHKVLLQNGNLGIVLAFTVDEERGCVGINRMDSELMQQILSRVQYGILAEPTQLCPIYAHKGNCWYQIVLHGKAAHGSVPDQGDNAIIKAAKLIPLLEEYATELQTHLSPLGSPTLNIGTISGGDSAQCRT